jgi:catechol 2,3-dioxygenase-like lactoylglutathione lyase family enzyme
VNLDLFAGVRVTDIVAARSWYERLLGAEPAFLPNEIEAVWVLAEHQYLYVLEDQPRAGRALVTVMVDDLDATVEALAARGIEPDERETFPGGARKAIYHYADGNEVGFGNVPPSAM